MTKYFLNDADRRKTQHAIAVTQGGSANNRPLARRRRVPIIENASTMLEVTIQSAVSAATSTFTVPQAAYRVVYGSESRDPITIHNTRSETLSPGDKLPVWKRAADGDYEPDRQGSGTGTFVVHYELTEDMALADTAKLAKPVLANGTMDSGASAFYVVDQGQQFVGRAAWTDAVGSEHGFRGYALKFADDYSGGVPGYRIISQDGPLRDIVVTLNADGDDGGGPFTVTPVSTDYYGAPFNGRRPVADSATGAFEAHDPHSLAEFAKQGEKWLAKYNESTDQYDLMQRLELAPFGRIRGKVAHTVDRTFSTVQLIECEAVEGREPPATVTASIPENAKLNISNGYTGWIYARFNELAGATDATKWDTDSAANMHWMLRGKKDWDAAKKMVLSSEGADEPDIQWKEAKPLDVIVKTATRPDVRLTWADDILEVEWLYTTVQCLVLDPQAEVDVAITDTLATTPCPEP